MNSVLRTGCVLCWVVSISAGCGRRSHQVDEESVARPYLTVEQILALPELADWLPPDESAAFVGSRPYSVDVEPSIEGPYRVVEVARRSGDGLRQNGSIGFGSKKIPYAFPTDRLSNYLVLLLESEEGELDILVVRAEVYMMTID